jgi:hypothetical protein
MKHLKTFENENFISAFDNKLTYYKIYAENSLLKFDAALMKIGLYYNFYDENDHKETWNDIIFKNDFVYLSVELDSVAFYKVINNRLTKYNCETHLEFLTVYYDISSLENVENINKYVFGGNIRVTREDLVNLKVKLKVNKYNL